VVSFRAVPRILDLLRELGHLSLGWVPHFTSVINWTVRFGLAVLGQVRQVNTPWLAIIDLSIDIGVKKALVVLRVPIDALARRGSAIRLEDCECIGLRVMEHTRLSKFRPLLGFRIPGYRDHNIVGEFIYILLNLWL
jgi:hypothetical protein